MLRKKMSSRLFFLFLFLTSAACPFFSIPTMGIQEAQISEEVAVITGYPETLAICDYDIFMQTELEKNRLYLDVTLVLENKGLTPVEKVDFDLLAREKYYGMTVDLKDIFQEKERKFLPIPFTRLAEPKPLKPAEEGDDNHPKVTRVLLSPALEEGKEVRLRFRYILTEVDPSRKDLNYRIIALLPSGRREACLISDFSWIPQVMVNFRKEREADKRNFFLRVTKPTWRVTLMHPMGYSSMVVDGKLEGVENRDEITVSRWSCRANGLPQLFIGNSERVEIKDKDISVVFLLPQGDYEQDVVGAMGRFLIRAYAFYARLFGPFPNPEIHVAVSSAGMGGHGAMLGVFLNASSFQHKWTNEELLESRFFDETAAHELAHSWWGISVSSFGRGTKFLREAFCNLATYRLAQECFGLDKFAETRASLFYRRIAGNRLFDRTGDNANLAYTKGALVLDMLREEMGDDVFFTVLLTFAERFRDSWVTFADFVSLCNEISHRDWMPFFDQWCYGDGYPVYKLVQFISQPNEGGWKTSVTIRNEGTGIVRCPIILNMSGESERQFVRVPGGEEKTFTFRTSRKVEGMTIDPEHTAYQGDESEARLKVLAVKETQSGWINYWKGIVTWEIGKKEESADDISKAIDIFVRALGPGKAHPAFYFSRGLIYLQTEGPEKANEDLKTFMDRVLELAADLPNRLEGLLGTLAYAGIVSGTVQERQNKLLLILRGLTGKDIPLDQNLEGWRKWWNLNRPNFRVNADAKNLSPSGIK